MSNVESAITTAAGPQLLIDCHTCFMSLNTTATGASLGVGSASAGVGAGATSRLTRGVTAAAGGGAPAGALAGGPAAQAHRPAHPARGRIGAGGGPRARSGCAVARASFAHRARP